MGILPEKNETRIILIIAILAAIAIPSFSKFRETRQTSHVSDEKPQLFLLNFPKVNLDSENGERVEEIHLSVSCGHIAAVDAIPYDWNINIVSAVSAIEELHSSAGHGTSMLFDIGTMNNSFQIKIGEKECFDVAAKVITYKDDKNRKIELPMSKLKLIPMGQK